MMRPTARTVLIFAAGIPFALLTVIYDSSWWPLSFGYAALVVLIAASDLDAGAAAARSSMSK